MGEVVGGLLPLAVGLALSPVPIVAVVLMLAARRGRDTGLAFLGGWIAGIVVATVLLLLIADAIGMTGVTGEPKTSVSWIKLLLGVLLLTLAAKQWTARPGSIASAELPGWTRDIDGVPPARAATLGLMSSAASPKNLILCVATAITISEGELSIGGQIVSVIVFTVIAACSVAAPVIAHLADARTHTPLRAVRAWLEANSAPVTFAALLLLGALLLGRGLSGLI
ncbi:GAP family protein [Actinomadura fibrosa]|uniref:GAP family protein n=1 Tax=Actinomadura fibrosa TaxID=111802 RepID=A0ABW2XFS9_9ACTN|nr:GAP family protein [Actinomadura fibrosa]